MKRIFNDIKQRCYNEKRKAYPDYGGRGIRVHQRWLDDVNIFITDMGFPPSHRHTIDRINNDGGYEPGNVRWALRDVQKHNQRPRGKVQYRGISLYRGKFKASIARGSIHIFIGHFNTLAEAIAAYEKTERKLYGSS